MPNFARKENKSLAGVGISVFVAAEQSIKQYRSNTEIYPHMPFGTGKKAFWLCSNLN